MAAPVAVYSSTKTPSSQTRQRVLPSGPGQHMDTGVGRLTGARACASPCLCARVATHTFRVSVSVVLSIMQLLTLSRTPEPSLSLPLNMHPFPSPMSLSPPSSHKPSLPRTPNSMLHADEIRERCSIYPPNPRCF